jgi:hypothetical protein
MSEKKSFGDLLAEEGGALWAKLEVESAERDALAAELAVLREALEGQRRESGCFGAWCDRDWHSISCRTASAALSTPSQAADDLLARVRREERERCAVVVEGVLEMWRQHKSDATFQEAARRIRSLGDAQTECRRCHGDGFASCQCDAEPEPTGEGKAKS